MNENFLNKLSLWRDAEEQLTKYKRLEMELRKELFDEAFPSPQEGVNKVDLPEGWTLKATYKLNRTLDETTLPLIKNYLQSCGFNVDGLIEYKPTLVLKNYRILPEYYTNQETGEIIQPRKIFEQAMIIKPATPSLELEEPK